MRTTWHPSQSPSEEGFVIHTAFIFWFHFTDTNTKHQAVRKIFLGIIKLLSSLGTMLSKASDGALLVYIIQVTQLKAFRVSI